MARPRKRRRLSRQPQAAIFKPVGLRLDRLERVILLHEELEALRLADLEGQHQQEAASHMGVSRSTFQRVVLAARQKVARALVNGLALQIEGGTFRVAELRWHCSDCGHDWELLHGAGQGQPSCCPACGSSAIRERPGEGRRHRR
jgi:predicted DNA-binding protein (UPF0251 family)